MIPELAVHAVKKKIEFRTNNLLISPYEFAYGAGSAVGRTLEEENADQEEKQSVFLRLEGCNTLQEIKKIAMELSHARKSPTGTDQSLDFLFWMVEKYEQDGDVTGEIKHLMEMGTDGY